MIERKLASFTKFIGDAEYLYFTQTHYAIAFHNNNLGVIVHKSNCIIAELDEKKHKLVPILIENHKDYKKFREMICRFKIQSRVGSGRYHSWPYSLNFKTREPDTVTCITYCSYVWPYSVAITRREDIDLDGVACTKYLHFNEKEVKQFIRIIKGIKR